MAVRIYRSTDASAPSLTGQTGSLCTVLDAILVNGYGSQTAAGWTIAFTGTSKRNYTMAAGGTGCSLYVDDSGPGAGTFKEARINGFLTSTALGTGTGQFPTFAQVAIGIGEVVVRKSTTADGTARPWTCIADGHTIYFFAETGDYTAPTMTFPWMFGDFFSYSASDTSNCAIIGRTIENSAIVAPSNGHLSPQTTLNDAFAAFSWMNSSGLTNTLPGHFACANYTNVGGSIALGKHSDQTKMGGMYLPPTGYPTLLMMQMGYLGFWTNGTSNSGVAWPNQFVYPNGPDGGLYCAPVWIHHNGIVRGYFKGLWNPLQNLPLNHSDTYSGTGNLSGKSFVAQNILGLTNFVATNTPTYGPAQVHIETSNTWS